MNSNKHIHINDKNAEHLDANKKKKIINIAFACDNKYARYTGAVICSILKNLSSDKICHFYILSTSISQENKDRFLKLKRFKQCEVFFIKPDESFVQIFKDIKLQEHVKIETFYKFSLPLILPKLDRILFLDSDIVVLEDISPLYESTLEDFCFAAVEDANQRLKIPFGYPDEYIYFNSGVILFNIKQIKNSTYMDRIKTKVKENFDKYKVSDQDMFNDCFYDKIKKLSYKYNLHHTRYGFFNPMNTNDYFASLNKPVIWHFTGPIKPWHTSKDLVYADRFINNLKFYERFADEIYYKILDNDRIISTHSDSFLPYKNKHSGKDFVLLASGPSAKIHTKIDNAIYVGVNKSLLHSIKLDYLFVQDFRAFKNFEEEIFSYECEKFFGICEAVKEFKIPLEYALRSRAKIYYQDTSLTGIPSKFAFDLSKERIGCFENVVFAALQFILYAGAKRIFLVGCDCSNEPYFYAKDDKSDLNPQRIINNYKKFKNFVQFYYPDVEVLSINPVGLKGIFDEY